MCDCEYEIDDLSLLTNRLLTLNLEQQRSRYASNRKWCVDCYNSVDSECDTCFRGRAEIEAELTIEINDYRYIGNHDIDNATFHLQQLAAMGFVEYIRTFNRPFLGRFMVLNKRLNEDCRVCQFFKDECSRCKSGREDTVSTLWDKIDSIHKQCKISTSKRLRILHSQVNNIVREMHILQTYGYVTYLTHYRYNHMGVVNNPQVHAITYRDRTFSSF